MDLIDQLESQIQILVIAAHDMDQASAACAELEREEVSGPLSKTLATAIAVSYARPFTANTIGRLGKQWTPKSGTPEREIHDWLLEERKKRYAHTDKDAMRSSSIAQTSTGSRNSHSRSRERLFPDKGPG
jgi:hypothetical protein